MTTANGVTNTERKQSALPLDKPDVVRTVPSGTALRIGDSVVLAIPRGGDVRYLVWSRFDIAIAKLDGEDENARVSD